MHVNRSGAGLDLNAHNPFVQQIKMVCLLLVVFSHVTGIIGDALPRPLHNNLWILVDAGLCYLAASSAYFTSLRYAGDFDVRSYWVKKIRRILAVLLLCNGFLFVLLLFRGAEGLFHWHTLVHAVGLSGWLNWLHIRSVSPLGAGLWFLTLLLLFYALYPIMNRLLDTGTRQDLLVAAGLAAVVVLPTTNPYGVALWSTAFGFLAGYYIARRGLRLEARHGLLGIGLGFGIGVAARLTGVGGLGYTAVALIGSGLFLVTIRMNPRPALRPLAYLSGAMFPIYIIHQYLIVRPLGHPLADTVVSMVLSVAVGLVLARATGWVTTFRRR